MAIVAKMKVIKPKALKEKEMRLELLNGLRSVGKKVLKDFEATVKTWDHKPKFELAISLKGKGPQFIAGTDDEIYGYVNFGTRPHRIVPKRAKVLRFRGTYSAKTTPGVIGSKSGGSSGDVVFSKGVNHPGTKARNFDKQIGKKWEKSFRGEMHDAMKRARAKSGHSI